MNDPAARNLDFDTLAEAYEEQITALLENGVDAILFETIFDTLNAKVPLKELSNYATALSSITGGRASFSMKFSNYELVPTDIQNKLIKEFEEQNKDED